MGTWGTGIFQNDVADGVRTDYKNKLRIGKSDVEALDEIINENIAFINDDDDKFDFWFGLASIMFDLGRLTDTIKNTTLELLDSKQDLVRWEDNKGDLRKRIIQLEKLKEKLLSQQPARKNISIAKPFVCSWKIDDIFVYRPHYFDKYILIAVDKFIRCDADIEGLGEILPVTFIKICNEYPQNIDDINNALFLPHYYDINKEIAEYRFMWFKKGFSKASKIFEYVGNMPFDRPCVINCEDDDGLCYCESWQRLDICVNNGTELMKSNK